VLDLVLGVTLDDPNMFALLAPIPLALPARSAPPPPGKGLLPEEVAFPPHHQLKRTRSANTFVVVIVGLIVIHCFVVLTVVFLAVLILSSVSNH